MKRLTFLSIALLASINVFAQLEAAFDYAVFQMPDHRTYIETYIQIGGESVVYMPKDVNLESKIDVTMVLKNADKMVEFRHFTISNPPLPDTTIVFNDFSDLQRIFIPQGVYNFELKMRDINAPKDKAQTIECHEIITVDIPDKSASFSGIEFIDEMTPTIQKDIFTKTGFDCKPYSKNSFNPETETLRFYTEIYNVADALNNTGDCQLTIAINEVATKKTIMFQKSKLNALNYYQLIKEIDIKNLPQGDYFIELKVLNSKNVEYASAQKYFHRNGVAATIQPLAANSNELQAAMHYNSADSLYTILQMHLSIADSAENKAITRASKNDLSSMRQLLYTFWVRRDANNPNIAFSNFEKCLKMAQQNNYTNEQLRTIARYGIPNNIDKIIEGVEQPFEIWHYYKIANLTNVKFIFVGNKNAKMIYNNIPCETTPNADWKKQLLKGAKEPEGLFNGL